MTEPVRSEESAMRRADAYFRSPKPRRKPRRMPKEQPLAEQRPANAIEDVRCKPAMVQLPMVAAGLTPPESDASAPVAAEQPGKKRKLTQAEVEAECARIIKRARQRKEEGLLPSQSIREQTLLEEDQERYRQEEERLEQERLAEESRQKCLRKQLKQQARVEKERLEQEHLERKRLRKQHKQQAREEAERVEQERLAEQSRVRKERKRLKRERRKVEQAEKERVEKERLQQVRLEEKQAEKQRRERERAEEAQLLKEQKRYHRVRLGQERARQKTLPPFTGVARMSIPTPDTLAAIREAAALRRAASGGESAEESEGESEEESEGGHRKSESEVEVDEEEEVEEDSAEVENAQSLAVDDGVSTAPESAADTEAVELPAEEPVPGLVTEETQVVDERGHSELVSEAVIGYAGLKSAGVEVGGGPEPRLAAQGLHAVDGGSELTNAHRPSLEVVEETDDRLVQHAGQQLEPKVPGQGPDVHGESEPRIAGNETDNDLDADVQPDVEGVITEVLDSNPELELAAVEVVDGVDGPDVGGVATEVLDSGPELELTAVEMVDGGNEYFSHGQLGSNVAGGHTAVSINEPQTDEMMHADLHARHESPLGAINARSIADEPQSSRAVTEEEVENNAMVLNEDDELMMAAEGSQLVDDGDAAPVVIGEEIHILGPEDDLREPSEEES